MNDDAALLRCYVDDGSEEAFTELVRRYVPVVYAAAMRRVGGDAHHAADVAQLVFTSLAQHARRLVHHPALGAWLHAATRNAAINLMKAEQRRRQREMDHADEDARDFATPPEWEQLRPLLDAAIDQLPEKDRIAVVQRFLEQRDYGAIGATFHQSADAARMRTDRALEKLRRILRRRGVTSTTAALGIVLGQQTLTAVPAGLAASISTTALATAHSGASALVTTILMSKLTTSTAVAVLTAGITAVVWNSVSSAPSATELADLRTENTRLVATTAPDASPATVAAAADEFDERAAALARVMQERSTRARATINPSTPGGNATSGAVDGAATSSGHRNRGQSTPVDVQMTFAWAADVADIDVLAKLLWFDGDGRAAAAEILAGFPPSVRTHYATPEALYAMFLSAQTQLGPPPGPEWFATLELVEVSPGRVKFRRPGATGLEFWASQQTDDGWKVVIPPEIVPVIAQSVLSSDFFAQLSPTKP